MRGIWRTVTVAAAGIAAALALTVAVAPAQANHETDGGGPGWGSGTMTKTEWNNVAVINAYCCGDTQVRVQTIKCDCTGGKTWDGTKNEPDGTIHAAKEIIYHTADDSAHLAYVRYWWWPYNGGEYVAYVKYWCNGNGGDCDVVYNDISKRHQTRAQYHLAS